MTRPRSRRWTRLRVVLSTTAAVVLCASFTNPVQAKLQPHKRTYDSHVYYVVELDSSQLELSQLSPESIATLLGAEHVEQVGELKDHYLIRAEQTRVDEGDETWFQVTRAEPQDDALANWQHQLRRRDETRLQAGKRDQILERYDLLKRHLLHNHSKRDSSQLSQRSSPRLIRSLERQTPRLRVKRDLPVLPPTDSSFLGRIRERAVIDLAAAVPSSVHRTIRQTASIISKTAAHFGIVDPLWSKQWHLVNGIMEENSINVTGVWDEGVFGKGVNVAIVDDGLDMHSDDLAANFHAEGSWDYNDNTPLPEPRLSDDQHGTRCAGEIAAVKNDVCGVGVAHQAGIAGIRILSASISDADEASSLNYGYQTNDIYSCSWGPPDDGRSMEAPGRLITKAMLNGVTNGRGGKGSVFVFASGNGGAVDDQCNFDGYTNSLMSITVGAIDRKGLHPFYSEACAANMVVTYSSGSGDNIHTTDVGKNVCTDRHGGTSAAAPIAAGIFALVLEARPDLTWRDMQHLCVRTAVQINPADPDWQMTASGRWYNHKYGFGKLDAWAIVNAARSWSLVKPQTWWNSPLARAPTMRGLTTGGSRITKDGVAASMRVTKKDLEDANLEELEHVTVTVFIEHERRGNIEVELMSPKGMKSILARPRRFDEAATGMLGWKFMTVKHWDEDPVGVWTLRVRDTQDNGKTGTFYSWTMQLWGSTIDASKAKAYELPEEADQYPEDPLNTGSGIAKPSDIATATSESGGQQTEDPLSPTKAYVKPTVHLPDDHAEATGEAHSSFGGAYPTLSPKPSTNDDDDMVKTPAELAEEENNSEHEVSIPAYPSETGKSGSSSLYDQTPGYLSGLSTLVGSTTWLFVAFGTIVIFVAGTTAFLVLRKRRAKSATGARGAFDFLPQSDFDEDDEDGQGMPMGAMERGRVRLGDDEHGGGGGRTRELFNAFALHSDEEEEDDSDDESKRRIRRSGDTDRRMESFLDDDEEEDSIHERGRRQEGEQQLLSDSRDSLTQADRERRAREEFSD
ncbi:S8 family peptidase [Sporobolomyces koalae]|uniref:S8 family peptidase n=1 Tax=Sporobolomyces koalae TaxID=500713 RepID=UPI0031815B2D